MISTDDHLNIVLEYIESGSLAAIIKRFTPFKENLVAFYVKQVLEGLCYLHSQGVVHRDIKGANLLTTKEGVVKLADFGVAMKLTETTKSMSIVGTPYWMAPEIVEQTGHCTTACDIWSLSCTVIELLTGSPPYFSLETMSALYRIVQDDCPPLPPNISSELKDFLLKCFQKEPLIRIDAPGLLKHDWILNYSAREEIHRNLSTEEECDFEVRVPSPVGHRRCGAQVNYTKNEVRFEQVKTPSAKMDTIKEEVKETSRESVKETPQETPKIAPVKSMRSLLSKSTKIESSDFENFGSMEKLSRLRSSVAEMHRSSDLFYDPSDTQYLDKLIDAIDSQKNLNYAQAALIDLLKERPSLKEFATPVLSILKQILDENDNFESLHLALQLVNCLCEDDNLMQEVSACLGLFTVALRYIGEEYYKELRIEAAYLIGQLFQSSSYIVKLVLASGGIEAVVKLLDPNYDENRELVVLGIDCLLALLEEQGDEYLRIWAACGAIERLALSLDNLSGDPDNYEYLQKTANLILAFSTGSRSVLLKFCEEDILSIVMTTLHSLPTDPKIQVLTAIQYLASDRSLQNRLENIGFIVDLVKILKNDQDKKVKEITLRALSFLCKLSPPRQEQAVLAGVVPALAECIPLGGTFAHLGLSLLSSLVSASSACRAHLHSCEIVSFLIAYLPSFTYVFDCIATWVSLEPQKCEAELCKKHNIQKLINFFRDNSHTLQSLQCMLKMLSSSENLSKMLSENQLFLESLFNKLTECQSEPSKIKHCLELLLVVVSNNDNPRQLLDLYNFYPLIVKILHTSRDDDLVVLEEIATLLLAIYSHGHVTLPNLT